MKKHLFCYKLKAILLVIFILALGVNTDQALGENNCDGIDLDIIENQSKIEHARVIDGEHRAYLRTNSSELGEKIIEIVHEWSSELFGYVIGASNSTKKSTAQVKTVHYYMDGLSLRENLLYRSSYVYPETIPPTIQQEAFERDAGNSNQELAYIVEVFEKSALQHRCIDQKDIKYQSPPPPPSSDAKEVKVIEKDVFEAFDTYEGTQVNVEKLSLELDKHKEINQLLIKLDLWQQAKEIIANNNNKEATLNELNSTLDEESSINDAILDDIATTQANITTTLQELTLAKDEQERILGTKNDYENEAIDYSNKAKIEEAKRNTLASLLSKSYEELYKIVKMIVNGKLNTPKKIKKRINKKIVKPINAANSNMGAE